MGAAVSGGRGGQDGPPSLRPPGHGAVGQAGEAGRGSGEGCLLPHLPSSPHEGAQLYVMYCHMWLYDMQYFKLEAIYTFRVN